MTKKYESATKNLNKHLFRRFLTSDRALEPGSLLLTYMRSDLGIYLLSDTARPSFALFDQCRANVAEAVIDSSYSIAGGPTKAAKKSTHEYIDLQVSILNAAELSVRVRSDLIPIIETMETMDAEQFFRAISEVNRGEIREVDEACHCLIAEVLAEHKQALEAASNAAGVAVVFGLFAEVSDRLPLKLTNDQEALVEPLIKTASRSIQNLSLVSGSEKSGRSVLARVAAERFAESYGSKLFRLNSAAVNDALLGSLITGSGAKMASDISKMVDAMILANGGKRPVILLDDIDLTCRVMLTKMQLGHMFTGAHAGVWMDPFLSRAYCIGSSLPPTASSLNSQSMGGSGPKTQNVGQGQASSGRASGSIEPYATYHSNSSCIKADLPILMAGIVNGSKERHSDIRFDEGCTAQLLSILGSDISRATVLAVRILDQAIGLAITSRAMVVSTALLTESANILAPSKSVGASTSGPAALEMARTLKANLSKKVYGQDEAIDAVSSKMKVVLGGLNVTTKPLASFLFVGPTGVGKTELAKELAMQLGINLTRIDMSEFAENESIWKLIGTPPGFRDGERGGLLSNALLNNPRSLILLDETEKACPLIHNIFLQIMDSASFRDGHGEYIDCSSAIFIFTSNAGSSKAASLKSHGVGIGFKNENHQADTARAYVASMNAAVMAGVEKTFAPEFRGRLDGIIVFAPLTKIVAIDVASRVMKELAESIRLRHSVEIVYGNELIESIAGRGYDIELGARTIIHIVERTIKPVIADCLLSRVGVKTITLEVGSDGKVFGSERDQENAA